MNQLVQVAGSLLILAAFVGAQRGWLPTSSRQYLSLNLIGSCALAAVAATESQIGFLLLESCWAAVTGYSLARSLR